jgi:hypothetical protein
VDGFQKLVQRWRKCIEVLLILWENNYAALKIIDVGIFLFFISLKHIFPFIFHLSGGKTCVYQPALVVYKTGTCNGPLFVALTGLLI